MRLCRFTTTNHPTPRFAVLEEEALKVLRHPPWEDLLESGEVVARAEATLCAPVEPSKVVAVGLNYRAHAAEMNKPLPERPRLFIKPSTSVVGPLEPIVLPPQSKRVDHEGELAVVMGRRASALTESNALGHVLGYTCLNDVTARDLQVEDGQQYTRAKGFDTFCPLGPWIETALDPDAAEVSLRVNGELRQSGNSRDMVFKVAALLSYISNIMTLLPGDVVTTGTPAGVGALKEGDVVEVTIAGIGTLQNPVRLRG